MVFKYRLPNGQWVSIPVIRGQKGVGIENISKTNTEGLVDTYTITYTDGTTSVFTVTNGKGGVDSYKKSETDQLLAGKADNTVSYFDQESQSTKEVTVAEAIVELINISTTYASIIEGLNEKIVTTQLNAEEIWLSENEDVLTVNDGRLTLNGAPVGSQEIYVGDDTPPEDAKIHIDPNDIIELADEPGNSVNKVLHQAALDMYYMRSRSKDSHAIYMNLMPNDYAISGEIRFLDSWNGASIIRMSVVFDDTDRPVLCLDDADYTLPILRGVFSPVQDNDVANKAYVDSNKGLTEAQVYSLLSNKGNLENGKTAYQNTVELYSLKFHDSDTGKHSAEFWHNPSEGFWFEFRGEEGYRCFYLDFGSETVNKVTYHNVFCIYGNKGKLSFNNKSITGLAEPTDNSDAATKHYVDTHTPTLEYATESEIDNIFVS